MVQAQYHDLSRCTPEKSTELKPKCLDLPPPLMLTLGKPFDITDSVSQPYKGESRTRWPLTCHPALLYNLPSYGTIKTPLTLLAQAILGFLVRAENPKAFSEFSVPHPDFTSWENRKCIPTFSPDPGLPQFYKGQTTLQICMQYGFWKKWIPCLSYNQEFQASPPPRYMSHAASVNIK